MSPARPLILITNDDGIGAPGLRLLHDQLSPMAQVVVCAPAQEQSAVGHGLTLHSPLRLTDQ